MELRTWEFENGITVREREFDYSLHCFEVYDRDAEDKYLGTIYPANLADMEYSKKRLDAGEDPISGGWDDGNGHGCRRSGWADED